MSPPSNTEADTDYESLIAGIKRLLMERLRELMSDMVDGTNDRLFELTGSTQDNLERNQYYELMRQFRDYKPLIYDDFFINVEQLLRPHTETTEEKSKQKQDAEGELSLIDQDVMEGIVMVTSLGEKIAGGSYETLSEIEIRLDHLAEKTDSIFAKDALAPINFCQAFDNALGKNFKLRDKKPLFQIFYDIVASEFGDIYGEINKLLITADILPDIKPQAPVQPTEITDNRAAASHQNEQVQQSFSGENDQTPNASGYAMTAAPGQGYNYPSESGGNPSRQRDTPAASGNMQRQQSAGMPANQVSETIGNYIGTPIGSAAPGTSGAPGESAFFPEPSAQAYGHQEILNALSNIQNNPEFNQADKIQHDTEIIKQAVLAEIARTSGGVVTKQINQIAEKTINFIELIFDAIIEDESISDTIKTLLLRLQIPVIKAAMMDNEFFVSDTHPARILLDRIAEVGIGITAHTDDMYVDLDELITRIVNEFELNTEAFQNALDELNALVEDRNKEAYKKEEEAQRKVLREHARNTVLKALRKITSGKTLPESVHPLILKRWPTLMFNHYLSQGKENDEWVVINEVLRDIVDSVQPINSAEELVSLVSIRHQLSEAAYQYLIRTEQPKQDIHNVIKGLEDAHSFLIDNSEFSIEQVNTADETIVTEYTAPTLEDHEPAEEELKATLPTDIMPGMWFKVYMGEDSPARRCKLSVIIAADAKLVFVNYQGEILVEKNFDEFALEMKEEKSKVIMGHSAFDHALSRVVTQLRPQA